MAGGSSRITFLRTASTRVPIAPVPVLLIAILDNMSRCPTCGNTGHPATSCPRKGELTKKRAAIAMSGGGGGGRDPHVPPPPSKRAKAGAGARRMTRAALERAIAEADEPDDLRLFPRGVRAARRGARRSARVAAMRAAEQPSGPARRRRRAREGVRAWPSST